MNNQTESAALRAEQAKGGVMAPLPGPLPVGRGEGIALRARAGTEVAGEMARVMFAPAGVHTISCGCGGVASAVVSVKIDAETARVLQASLEAANANSAPQRACFDKNHEEKEAMAWPTRFLWSETPEPGVYAEVEWSDLGKQYVQGKVFRAFSGAFYSDAALPKPKTIRSGQSITIPEGKRGSESNPARMTGLVFPFAGTLTNDPAFRQIMPLWAERAGGKTRMEDGGQKISGVGTPGSKQAGATGESKASTERATHDHMITAEQKAALQAKKQQLEQQITGLKAQEQTAEVVEELQKLEAEFKAIDPQLQLAAQQEHNQELEAALLAQRKKDAKAAVQAAVKRGAIPTQNLELQQKWETKCTEDPSNIELLASMRGSPAVEAPARITINPVRIVREDSVAVLNAFNAERDPLRRAAIYAKEIKARLAEGDDMPLRAANSAGTLAGTLVTQRTLELLKLVFPVLSSISTDFSDQQAVYGQTIATRIIGIPTVQTYNQETGWANSDATMTDVTVALNNHKGVPITFDAQTLASTVRRLFDEIAPAQAYALAKDMVDALYAIITAANFTEAATTAAQVDFGRPTVIDMSVALTGRGVPLGPMNRTLLLNSNYFGQLSKDNAIVTLAAFQKSEIIEQGVLPNVQGFRVVEAPNLPATGNLTGFGFSKSAMVIVARVDGDYTSVLPGASYGNSSVVTDPDLGISVLQVQYVNHQLASATQRISLLYGVAKGQPKAGQILKSA